MTRVLQGIGPGGGELRILVIGNSAHHAKSLVLLMRELIRLDRTVRATLVCSASAHDDFAKTIAASGVELVSFEQGMGAAHAPVMPNAQVDNTSRPSATLKKLKLLKKCLIQLPGAMPIFRKQLEFILAKAWQSTLGLVLREWAALARLKQEKFLAQRLFDQISPNLIVAFGDRHPDIEAPILSVARERGIKVVIPYATYSGKDNMVVVRRCDPDSQTVKPFSFYRRVKAAHFRDQLYEGLFYQPPCSLTAYEKFGVLSSYPWCLGNGLSDIVCVDSEVTAQRYRKDRVPPQKIRIIGDVVYDKLADGVHRRREIRAIVVEKYGFANSRKLIVLALPPLAERDVMDWESHWREIRFLVEEVSKAGQNLLISLHPRMNPKDYAFLEQEYSCRIGQERLSDFISTPDVFVTSYSSTVVWAVLCGIKAVIVDFYGLNYDFCDYLKSVSIVRDRERLQRTLATAIQGDETDFSVDWGALSRHKVLDGRTIERYLDLFRELANASEERKPTPER